MKVNGRRLTEYSDEDVETLRTVTKLRSAMLSVGQIREMLDEPSRTAEVFAGYREELKSEFERLTGLIERVEAIEPEDLDSAAALADALDTEEFDLPTPETPRTDRFRIGRLDDGTTDDERRAAYEEWCRKKERRDKAGGALFDRVWYGITWKKAAVVIGVVLALLAVWFVPFPSRLTFGAAGWEIRLGDPLYAEPVNVRVDGTVWHKLFCKPVFEGTVAFDRYLPYTFTADGWQTFEEAPSVTIGSDGVPLFGGKRIVEYRAADAGRRAVRLIGFDFQSGVLAAEAQDFEPQPNGGWASADAPYLIVCPADNRTDAYVRALSVLEAYVGTGELADVPRGE